MTEKDHARWLCQTIAGGQGCAFVYNEPVLCFKNNLKLQAARPYPGKNQQEKKLPPKIWHHPPWFIISTHVPTSVRNVGFALLCDPFAPLCGYFFHRKGHRETAEKRKEKHPLTWSPVVLNKGFEH